MYRKYTSVYLLLSTNSFACMFRELPYWRPEWQTRSPNRPTVAAACNHQAAATTANNSDQYNQSKEEAFVAKGSPIAWFRFRKKPKPVWGADRKDMRLSTVGPFFILTTYQGVRGGEGDKVGCGRERFLADCPFPPYLGAAKAGRNHLNK